ncbi:polysaccharide deacetylase family protein [Paraflavisolibacter sp. H34]|uniref:polysaccharide deacetylase family protein n=1 Tax=Huijunlia imazamoxiresistens TaxID=3127457 RepID=UPI00301A6D8B
MKKAFFYCLLAFLSLTGSAQVLKKPLPDKLVVLTFDDAPVTHYTFVAPLLKKYGFGATFFVCEFPPDFADTSLYMNWRMMHELGNMGFEVANHTHTHKHVNRLTREQLGQELAYIEQKLDSLRLPRTVSFAYPAYDTHPTALEVLNERGYAFARAGGYRLYDPLTDHPYLVPSYTAKKDNREQILQALEGAKGGKIAVLTLHGVPDYAHDWVTTPPALFEEYLNYLHDHHFKVIAMKDLQQYINVPKALETISPDFTQKLK